MVEVAKIIESIGATSGKKAKKEILTNHKDNEMLCKVLNHLYNPYVKTNIAQKKLAKEVVVATSQRPLLDVYDYMDYLSSSTGKDENIAVVQAFITSQPEEVRWLLEAMAIKKLTIGATGSSINEAFGYAFIPSFELMLAEKYIEVKRVKGEFKVYEHWKKYIGKRVIATKKLDGNRACIFVRDNGVIEIFSREGHLLEGYVEIKEAFAQFPKGQVYDGELLATNEEGLNSKDLYKKTSSIMRKKGVKKGLEFHAFDLLPIEKFEQGGFEVSCEKRKEALGLVVGTQNHELVKYVEPLYIGEFDKEIIDGLADVAKANGEEGIMVQLADVGYACKRTFDILKVKSFESADLRCLGIYEGKSGRNIGSLGGFVLDFHGNRVNVGSGIPHEIRDAIWKNPDLALNKIIEIQYFEAFEEEDGTLDLRFASFKTIREDKTEPSYY
ncbi:hypothetical protein BAGA_05390 [Bacillus gaemokensis]|uniref:ATP-dependent DNA ligase n=1 Tax=Bacillus gaemokensis TaxID=574375 RepID=A0A073KBJ0_9BACI|nr:hypothetical protein BAGA_05390 [Bacillus gaemokensis]KYG38160.1 hypothetical protein AZF08_20425 [Bacillus gaemokensis]